MTDDGKGPRYIAFAYRGIGGPENTAFVGERQADGGYMEVAQVAGGLVKARELADALNDREDLRKLDPDA